MHLSQANPRPHQQDAHSPPPQVSSSQAQQHDRQKHEGAWDSADMTPIERENAIELFELREAWFDFEGLHDKAAEARQIHQSLAAGRNYQGAK